MLIKESTLPGGNAGCPDTKYLNDPQGMEDVTLKESLLPSCINHKLILIIRSLTIYGLLIP